MSIRLFDWTWGSVCMLDFQWKSECDEPYLCNTEMPLCGRSLDTQWYKDIWILSASVPLSPNVSYLIFSLYHLLCYSLHDGLCLSNCLCSLLSAFPQMLEFMCLVDPEAVNLVIHNQYQPHPCPTDKSGLSDNYVFSSLCLQNSALFLRSLFWSRGFFFYWFGLFSCTGPF